MFGCAIQQTDLKSSSEDETDAPAQMLDMLGRKAETPVTSPDTGDMDISPDEIDETMPPEDTMDMDCDQDKIDDADGEASSLLPSRNRGQGYLAFLPREATEEGLNQCMPIWFFHFFISFV